MFAVTSRCLDVTLSDSGREVMMAGGSRAGPSDSRSFSVLFFSKCDTGRCGPFSEFGRIVLYCSGFGARRL